MVELVEKTSRTFLIFKDGLYFGQVEQIHHDWVFHPRAGLDGPLYAMGVCPLDALDQWFMAADRGGDHNAS